MNDQEFTEFCLQDGYTLTDLCLQSSLNENSIVMDIGAYTGNWADQVLKKYNCRLYLLEPVPSFFETLQQKYQNNERVKMKNLGVHPYTKTFYIDEIDGDATILQEGKNSTSTMLIHLMPLTDIMDSWNLQHIDLLQINIEGAEYDVLDDLIESKKI